MKYLLLVLAAFYLFAAYLFAAVASAGDVPAVTAGEFVVDASGEASLLWSILAGQGPIGVILFGLLGLIWKFAKPYVDVWARNRKMESLFLASESAVQGVSAVYTDEIKRASADGKLTKEEAARARNMAVDFVVDFMRAQGIDVVKEYGLGVIQLVIESALARIKNPVAKAVAVTLPDLAPSPPSA